MINFPRVIKTNKSVILILLTLFTSGVFVGSLSVFNSVSNLNSDLFGLSDNVMVVSNSKDSTPFTSYVPNIYEVTLNQLSGVTSVSPEILVPIVINEKSTLIRGVNYQRVNNFSKLQFPDQPKIENLGPNDLLASKSLYDQNNFEIGQIIELKSTLRSVSKLGIIRAYFTSEDLSAPQIVATNNFVKSLSLVDTRSGPSGYTHYRIKYDPIIISPSRIREILNTQFEIEFGLLINNRTVYTDNWYIRIEDFFGNEVYEENRIDNKINVDLLRGNYTVFFAKSSETRQVEIFVDTSQSIDLILGNNVYGVNVTTLVNNVETAFPIQITSRSDEVISQRFNINSSEVTPTIETILPEGMYDLQIWHGDSFMVYPLRVNQSFSTEINVDTSLEYTPIIGLSNYTNYPISQQVFLFKNTPAPWENIYFEGNLINYVSNTFVLNLQEGVNQIVWRDARSILDDQIIEFTVNNSINHFEPQFSQYAKIHPSSVLNISLSNLLTNSITLDSMGEIVNVTSNNLQIRIPNIIGEYILEISGLDKRFNTVNYSINVTIQEIDKTAGLLTEIEEPTVNTGDVINYWYSFPVQNMMIDGINIEYNSDSLTIPYELTEGKHTLNITTLSSVNLFNIMVLDSSFPSMLYKSPINSLYPKSYIENSGINAISFEFYNSTTSNFINRTINLRINYYGLNVSMSLIYRLGDTIFLPQGEFNFEFLFLRFVHETNISNPEGNYLIETMPILIEFQIKISSNLKTQQLELYQENFPNNKEVIVDPDNTIEIKDFPAGNIIFKFIFSENLIYSYQRIVFGDGYVLEFLINVGQDGSEFDYSKFRNSNIKVNVDNSEAAAESSSSLLGLSNLLIISESIVIFLLLIISSAGVFLSYIYQNRNELKILFSIGMTNSQIMYSMLKQSILMTPITSLFGGWLGLKVTEFIFGRSSMTIFGINFFPEFNYFIFAINIFINQFLVIFGGYLGVLYTKYLLINESK